MPSAENITDPHVLNELTQGRKLYIQSCGSCHNLYVPDRFPDAHWVAEMDSMKVAAKITDEQAELILKYLTTETLTE